MTLPLALVLYEKLLPGSQLVNKLQDINYRVQSISKPEILVECAEQSKPMLVLVDLDIRGNEVCAAVKRLKENPATKHLPVIMFGGENNSDLRANAEASGAALIVNETALLGHLSQFLDQALQIE